jgi:predicted Rossmann fold nucleotide-binding protein DprA/Smf involved in DNA uptake
MKVGIAGSRERTDAKSVVDYIDSLGENDVVISGGCRGVDTWAEIAAKRRGLKTIVFLPEKPPKGAPKHEWTKAFYARNLQIAEACDVLVAFVSPKRKGGTENTINHAEKLGKPVIINYPNR